MCRIAGIISAGSGTEDIQKKVSLMCRSLQNGGPDDEGIFLDEKAGLGFGHRRLSIIDLSRNGHQPMADVNKKAWICFNGEIYNYPELKQELEKLGAPFNSSTDTEVILQAYLFWGTAAFAKLRGMFAFALYDNINALTYLVRDTSGIKPLYYYVKNNQVSFASEVRALKAAGIANEENPEWLIKFLAYGHIPEPITTLKNVFSLPKGHLLCWNHHTHTYNINTYTKAPSINYITDAGIAKKYIADTLTMAVNRQLIADAPIGVFLSGGIDSSLITLLASQRKQHQLKTVSIFFNEKNYDERAYQQQVYNNIQGEKFNHLVTQPDFDAFLPQIINAMDMPTTDGINSWFISKYAHEDGLKAVLSGIGGDELFGGYPSFNRIHYIRQLRTIPPFLLSLVKPIIPDRFKKLSYLEFNHPRADYLFLRGLFLPGDIARILNCNEKEIYTTLFEADGSRLTGNYDEEQAARFETDIYMQNQLLHDTDIMSMNHGLEVRVPFLDEDFQALVNNISPDIRFDKRIPKKLLIDSFKDILPKAVWNRPKMGFSFPLQQWMKQYKNISNEELYNNKTAKSIIKKFKNDEVHWSKPFALYQIQSHV